MERPGSEPRSRRRCLRAIAGIGVVSLAGCLNRGGSTEPTDVDASEVDVNASETDGENATGNDTEEVDEDADEGGDGDNEDDDGDNESDGDSDGSADAESDPIHPEYETREVVVETSAGDALGSVTAAIADTDDLRRTGLSDTESLPEDRGMLFVHGSVRSLTYWMREMDFGIDIVFADAEGVITGIHHAPAPGPDEDGTDQTYGGRGKYVLEVAYRWTEERGVSVGDVLVFDPVE
ncbi:DUF192 domain-containing protein [Halorubrum halodurans]|uniref:DUF192 domain-containing protein n=1 Tax=Halorubrum halodurans TaxID=1383851 RepID=A0A256IJ80_9EURY|nr:DUF192 domain-containing protein [Halorubrum halodurans]OYR56513.1 hypothetical protein DJ70_08755 [Halorubrum halodurans]